MGSNPKSALFAMCIVDLVAKRQPEIEPHIAHSSTSHGSRAQPYARRRHLDHSSESVERDPRK